MGPELEGVIRNAKDQGTQALYVWPSGFTFSFAKQLPTSPMPMACHVPPIQGRCVSRPVCLRMPLI